MVLTDERRVITEEKHHADLNEKHWEWTAAKEASIELDVEDFYQNVYCQRKENEFILLFVFEVCIIVVIKVFYDLFFADKKVFRLSKLLLVITPIPILLMNLKDNFVRKHPWYRLFSAWLTTMLFVVTDVVSSSSYMFFGSIWHIFDEPLVLIAIYIMLPIRKLRQAIILALLTSLIFLTCCVFIVQSKVFDEKIYGRKYYILIAETALLIYLNIFGIFMRVLEKVSYRMQCLYRKKCIQQNTIIQLAKDQERELLKTILPENILNEMMDDVSKRIENLKKLRRRPSVFGPKYGYQFIGNWKQIFGSNLYIKKLDNVGILYTDIVNFMGMTTTMSVKDLVETLHDLCVRFDAAAEQCNVQPIKFLGDCYNCVANVSIPNPEPAKSCVKLGLLMIDIVKRVRTQRAIKLSMRIGVHIGSAVCGIVGARKWQFDVWSKDVQIANHLEATGRPERIHISHQVLEFLDKNFIIQDGTATARNDVILKKYNITSYLVKAITVTDVTEVIKRELLPVDPKKGSNIRFFKTYNMNNVREMVNKEMEKDFYDVPIAGIPIRKLRCCKSQKIPDVDSGFDVGNYNDVFWKFSLFLKNGEWERMFMNLPDIFLKYSVLLSFIAYLFMVTLQSFSHRPSLFRSSAGVITFVMYLNMTLLVWYNKIWLVLIAKSSPLRRPRNKVSVILFDVSDYIQRKVWSRCLMYFIVVFADLVYVITIFQTCEKGKNIVTYSDCCFDPVAMTYSFCAIIFTSMLFYHIPHWIKVFITMGIVVGYGCAIHYEFKSIYRFGYDPLHSAGVNPLFRHSFIILFIFFLSIILDRHAECVEKLYFIWTMRLEAKKKDARIIKGSMKIVIQNFLPVHVAKMYAIKTRRDELYWEEYDYIAVMFASIENLDVESGFPLFNEIICELDEVLSSYVRPLKVEKIKLSNLTYIAACGLDVKRTRRSAPVLNLEDSDVGSGDTFVFELVSEVSNRSSASISSHPPDLNVACVLLRFAVDLLRKLNAFNMHYMERENGKTLNCALRIGMSCGEAVAGVIGITKPHYDIWGHSVNLASRMASTGFPGKIHVPKDLAAIFKDYKISCSYRDEIVIKGIGAQPTYFVDLNENYEILELKGEGGSYESEESSHSFDFN